MAGLFEKLYWSGFTAWQGRHERSFPFSARQEQDRVQDRRVRAIVSFAYEQVPFYRDFMKSTGLLPGDFRSAADLAKLPLLSSRELSANPREFRSETIGNAGGLSMETSGSTGLPTEIRHDTRALFLARVGGHRSRLVFSHFTGKSLGYREVKVTRRGGTGPEVLQFYREHSWVPGGIALQRAMVHPEESFAENIRVINEAEPEVVSGFGSYIGSIYRWAWMRGVPVFKPRVISYGGDAMQEPDRRIIEQEYGIPVISRYQACEALNIAFQCEKGRGFHISTDQVALRIVDPQGNSLPPGQTGEIVISNLINRATVLLNYRIGDLARLSEHPCDCGRTLPAFERLQGRTDDMLTLPDGEEVHESVVLSRLYAIPGVLQIQVVQQSLDRFRVEVVCRPQAEAEELIEQVTARFLELLGTSRRIDLEVRLVDHIPPEKNGKFRSVISLVRDR